MVYSNEMSLKQAAKSLGLSYSTIWETHKAALETLYAALKDDPVIREYWDEVAKGQQETNSSNTNLTDDSEGVAVTSSLREWALAQFSEEEISAGLHEIRNTGGLELRDFIDELEKAAGSDE
jgi:hypothetical protein